MPIALIAPRRVRRPFVFGAGRLAAAFVTLSASLGLPARATPLDPTGLWSTKGNGSIIKISPCGDFYCGTLAWMKEPNDPDGMPKLDRQNVDATKRNRPMVGIDLLLDLAPEKSYWRGKAYNPEDGKTYEITFKVITDQVPNDKAEIEGCLLRILCKTETFSRAPAIPKPTGAMR